MSENYKSGLSTAAHDKMDVQAYFSLVHEAVCHRKGGLIADVFSGGGRDILALRSLLKGDGRFVAIDADPLRIKDMLAKNDAGGAPLFAETRTRAALKAAFAQQKIAVLEGTFPDKPYGDTKINLKGKADFILCNAGIMFVPPQDLDKTLAMLAGMLAPKGEMFLRFSQERADKARKPDYHIHEPSLVRDTLMREGVHVIRNPDLPDPDKRGFSWVDLNCYKVG
ncbi:MAG: class I SAM-dependent methyltransferase [Alphaproteobacteria bacterium]